MMNRQFFVTVLAAAGLAWGGVMARGEELAKWNSTGSTPLAGNFPATTHAAGLTVSNLTAGGGLLLTGSSVATDTFSAGGYDQTSASAAMSANDWWETCLDAGASGVVPETLTYAFRASGSGPKSAQWAWSTDRSAWYYLGTPEAIDDKWVVRTAVDLSEVPTAGRIWLRMVAWGGKSANNAWGGFGKGDVVQIYGSVISAEGAPVVRFTPANGTVAVSNTFTMAVAAIPAGSGISKWSLSPTPQGTAALAGSAFTFTPVGTDVGTRFTLSVTATNAYGSTAAEATVFVDEWAPEGTLTLTFDNERQTSWSGAGSVEIPVGGGLTWKMENCMIGEDEEQDKVYAGAGKALRFAYDEPGAFQSLGKIVAVSKGTETVQTNGVAEVRFWYGIYGEDAGEESEHPVRPTLVTELSDDGKLWVEVDRVATEGSEGGLQKREIEVGVETPVYFRIRVEGVAGSSRVNVDQVRIVPKVTDRDQRVLFLLQHNVTPGDEKTGIEPTSKDDWDGDNVSNFQEFRDKTNPYDKSSFKAASVGK